MNSVRSTAACFWRYLNRKDHSAFRRIQAKGKVSYLRARSMVGYLPKPKMQFWMRVKTRVSKNTRCICGAVIQEKTLSGTQHLRRKVSPHHNTFPTPRYWQDTVFCDPPVGDYRTLNDCTTIALSSEAPVSLSVVRVT